MASSAGVFKGIVHGRIIELDRSVNLPDGEQVTVVLHRAEDRQTLPKGEGLRRAFGAWADEADGMDKFLEQLRHDRDNDDRQEPTP